jgi:hypothetical protein
MRQGQAVGAVFEVAEQQQVDVDQARRVPRPAGLAPLFTLDGFEYVEQVLGPEIGADPDRRIEEIGLVEDLSDRLGPPDR